MLQPVDFILPSGGLSRRGTLRLSYRPICHFGDQIDRLGRHGQESEAGRSEGVGQVRCTDRIRSGIQAVCLKEEGLLSRVVCCPIGWWSVQRVNGPVSCLLGESTIYGRLCLAHVSVFILGTDKLNGVRLVVF